MTKRFLYLFATILACNLIVHLFANPLIAEENERALIADSIPVDGGNYVAVVPTTANQPAAVVQQPSSDTRQGLRERLAAHGLVVGISYKAEVFGALVRGAASARGAAGLGSAQTSMELDLTKIALGRGQVFVGAQTLHGKGINDGRLGAIQLPSNLDAEPYTKVMEAWYGDSYFSDRLKIKVGRQYADADFDAIENGGDFLNASYGVIPTSPMPTYPLPSLGISAWVSATPWMSVGAGVFRGEKLDPVEDGAGPSLRKGVFTLAEAKFEPFSKISSRRGVYRVGVWQQGDGAWLANAADSATAVRNYGVYAVADYWFRQKSEQDRGPVVFLRWGWAPSDRNEISGYWGGGIAYPGLNPLRPQDMIGLGVTRVTLRESRNETVFELFYKLQLSKTVFFQPDLQWFHNPSGQGPAGAVAGLRLGLEF